jgi:hypothetical protein
MLDIAILNTERQMVMREIDVKVEDGKKFGRVNRLESQRVISSGERSRNGGKNSPPSGKESLRTAFLKWGQTNLEF